MSKSLGDTHYIGLMEDARSIKKKVMSAVTDLGLKDAPDEKSPGVANLFMLLRLCGATTKADALDEVYRRKELLYGHLKQEVYGALMAHLGPIRERRAALDARPDMVQDVLRDSAARAREIARRTLDEARQRMGLAVWT
jgi:tryptophanyl-tRNA synthetase